MGESSIAVHAELVRAVHDLDSRGLVQASTWAAEQLVGLEDALHPSGQGGDDIQYNLASGGHSKPFQPDSALSAAEAEQQAWTDAVQDRHPRLLLARCLMETKEYRRAAHLLKGVPGNKALFVRLYAMYLAGEKTKHESRVEAVGHLGRSAAPNPALDALAAELKLAVAEGSSGQEDAFLWYLLGLVLGEKGLQDAAAAALSRSLHLYPCNWSAWQALQVLVTRTPRLAALDLPAHWTRDFFLVAVCLDMQRNQEALSRLQSLSQLFRDSVAVVALVAQVHAALHNYDEAQALYEDLREKDPYRIEGLDVYSNILFVKEQTVRLSQLAQAACETDKYRPETCCIVGNFHSLKGQHEKALEYFQRALALNPNYLSAWTLMGHEYMEVKNTAAAVDAYRHAVELQEHDFRAWYGLGQAYELLKLPYYALYYYRQASVKRPEDPRMWCALAECYSNPQVNLPEAAIKCYRRAIEHDDPDGIAAPMLAKLHESRCELDLAEELYRYNLHRLEANGVVGQDSVDALLFLANRCKDTDRLKEAEQLCQRLMDVGGQAKEKAKALAREVRGMMYQAAKLAANATTPGSEGGLRLGSTPTSTAAARAAFGEGGQLGVAGGGGGGAEVGTPTRSPLQATPASPGFPGFQLSFDQHRSGSVTTGPSASGNTPMDMSTPARGNSQIWSLNFTPSFGRALTATTNNTTTPSLRGGTSTATLTPVTPTGDAAEGAHSEQNPASYLFPDAMQSPQQRTPPAGTAGSGLPTHDGTERTPHQNGPGGGSGMVMPGSEAGAGPVAMAQEETEEEAMNVTALVQQLQYSRAEALAGLRASGGDPVAAIRKAWYAPNVSDRHDLAARG